jgi:hypothetical protein
MMSEERGNDFLQHFYNNAVQNRATARIKTNKEDNQFKIRVDSRLFA